MRDDGPGIPPEDHERIFQRFGRTGAQDWSDQDGHGLGLAIARHVVESIEGRITVVSEPGVGSTFVAWLPDQAIASPVERERTPPVTDPLGR